jgi:hypothetical protein
VEALNDAAITAQRAKRIVAVHTGHARPTVTAGAGSDNGGTPTPAVSAATTAAAAATAPPTHSTSPRQPAAAGSLEGAPFTPAAAEDTSVLTLLCGHTEELEICGARGG